MSEKEYYKIIEDQKSSDLKKLKLESRENALLKGVTFQNTHILTNSCTLTAIPHTLFPSVIPINLFQQAQDLQPIINMLVHTMSLDHEFIIRSLENTEKNDEYVSGLLKILRNCKANQFPQVGSAAILRSDYMVDQTENSIVSKKLLKQVEVNTISASFGAQSVDVTEIHKINLYNLYQKCSEPINRKFLQKMISAIPENKTDFGRFTKFLFSF